MARVPCDILTGFLGSGKTTLLKHVLRHGLDGRRVAVVMNDLGDLGVEGQVVRDLGAVETVVELDNGCVCCSIGFQFALAVQDIVDRLGPELIVIETTGVADPGPLVEQVLQAGLALDAVITVVDAEQVTAVHAESAVTARQIEAADFLVLNKLDLVDDRQRRRAERRLRRLNDRALLVPASWGDVQTDVLFGTGVRAYRERLRAREEGPDPTARAHLDRDGLGAFVYRGERLMARDRFERLLRRLPRTVYRAKGALMFAGESMPSLFNYTCGRFDFAWYPLRGGATLRPQAVFVGRDLAGVETRIRAELAACEVDTPVAAGSAP